MKFFLISSVIGEPAQGKNILLEMNIKNIEFDIKFNQV